MVTTRRLVASAAAALLAFAAAAGGVPRTGAPGPDRASPTIEPTLPLVIDARFENIERAAGATTALLVIELAAMDQIRDLALESALPAGLRAAGAAWPPRWPTHLAGGEMRRFTLPVSAEGAGGQRVRLEASFRDAGGRSLALGQGVSLDSAAGTGRSHLGAFEVMAVPIEELRK